MKPSVIIKDGREAAYLQVARQLRSRLGEGKLLRDDGRLPSFRQLSAEYEVSICVIQQAMRLLREESLIEVHHGRSGRVVADAPVKTAILKLGLIHPYAPDGPFGRLLPLCAAQGYRRASLRCDGDGTFLPAECEAGAGNRRKSALQRVRRHHSLAGGHLCQRGVFSRSCRSRCR
ncbi:MAG: GntR family transcriptional regulator [Lentisphaeria bacterium]|nr:MAG: GntR family transcriptional regulator [Lentisphaeria bacterium]